MSNASQQRIGTTHMVAIGVVLLTTSTAVADIQLPVRKSDALREVAKAAIETSIEGRATSQTTLGGRQRSAAPPPRTRDVSGHSQKDPAKTYVPSVRRVKPTIPPKPAALQRWLSKL